MTFRILLAAVVFATALPGSAGASGAAVPASPLQVLAEARSALDAHQPERAERLLRLALERAPAEELLLRSELLSWLGRAHAQQGRFGDAVERLEEAVELRERGGGCIDAACLAILMRLGNVQMSAGHPDRSLKALLRARALAEVVFGPSSPETAEAWTRLGGAHLIREEWRAAEAAFREALRIREEGAGRCEDDLHLVRVNLAIALDKQGKPGDAVAPPVEGSPAGSDSAGPRHPATAPPAG